MNLFFEESGDFKTGTVLSQQGESYQVEMQTGKRTKVRAKDVLLHFATPTPAQLFNDAQGVADEIDIHFLWEVAGQEEFGFTELAMEYFGHDPFPREVAGLLLKLHGAPIYFYKKGKGRYKAAPEASVRAALAGIEKKKQQALIQARYAEELRDGRLPDAMKPIVLQLLYKPDKNSIEYRALQAVCDELQITPQRLMLKAGGVASPKDLHLSKFLFEYFPKGIDFPSIPASAAPQLPIAEVCAFSIDDVTTTEIDDAFSVGIMPDGKICVGIHIAAPALGIKPGGTADVIARQRLSTVYFPGDKITMLPNSLVDLFTLAEGRLCPAVSLYVTLDPQDWSVVDTETKAEAVRIVTNLRHNDLDALVTEENLAAGSGEYPHKNEITLLWQWAQVLERGRMAKRQSFGLRPEQTNRVDFNFYVENDVVTVVRRKRGAPLDKIVAELMIFANSTWGKLMHEHGVPGIYRSQGGWPGRMQVRMVTHAAPHQGLGVDQYAWSTSPLRRYTDLVNQWQILACIEHGIAAPLAAPFKPKDADLFAIVSAFDAAYGAYNDFQTEMERYWCLRWLAQANAKCVDAVVLKEDILRLVDIPLIIKMPGMQQVAHGTRVKLDLIRWDEIDLSIEARLIEIVDPIADGSAETIQDISIQEDMAPESMEEPILSHGEAIVEPVQE